MSVKITKDDGSAHVAEVSVWEPTEEGKPPRRTEVHHLTKIDECVTATIYGERYVSVREAIGEPFLGADQDV